MKANAYGKYGSVKMRGHHYRLFFIKPKNRANAHEYARKLASMDSVAEVLVTEGECGFIVKTRNKTAQKEKTTTLERSSYKQITSYLQYKR